MKSTQLLFTQSPNYVFFIAWFYEPELINVSSVCCSVFIVILWLKVVIFICLIYIMRTYEICDIIWKVTEE